MKLQVFLLTLLALLPKSSLAGDTSFGAGVGSLYSGLGLNIATRSSHELKYVSAGCVAYSTATGETCGIGAGWIKADLLNVQNNKHGLGAYLGVIGSDRSSWDKEDPVYGIGLGYHFFFNGIDKSGTTLGVTFVAGDTSTGLGSAAMIQLGYQF